MSFGTSILEGFRKGFGRVLGSQNPRFSHFFRCFFEVIFEARFESQKNWKKIEKNKLFRFLGPDFRCTGRAWGEIIERGNTKIS